jgi:hypothetical protein
MDQDIPTGSSSRQPLSSGRLPFSKVTLAPGAQRSHIIPQKVYKDLSKLFERIAEAKLPDGQLPFHPEDYRQNGQALPSDTSGANSKATFDVAQHRGSHPQVNLAMADRLRTIDADLSNKLAAATTPEARNLAQSRTHCRRMSACLCSLPSPSHLHRVFRLCRF